MPGHYREMTEAEWRARFTDPAQVSASEVPSILGVNRYESPYTLYCRKLGLIPPSEPSIATRVGKALEPLIADMFSEATGIELFDPGDYAVYSNPDTPWLTATLDREAVATASPVELKTTSTFDASAWREGDGPLPYQVQVLMQMYCTESQLGALAGLINSREFIHRNIEWRGGMMVHVMERVSEFRERCMNGDAPDVDGSASTIQTLKLLHPKDNGAIVDASDRDDVADWISMLEVAKCDKRNAEVRENQAKAKLMELIGDATYLKHRDGWLSYKHQTRKGFTVEPSESRTLRILSKAPKLTEVIE